MRALCGQGWKGCSLSLPADPCPRAAALAGARGDITIPFPRLPLCCHFQQHFPCSSSEESPVVTNPLSLRCIQSFPETAGAIQVNHIFVSSSLCHVKSCTQKVSMSRHGRQAHMRKQIPQLQRQQCLGFLSCSSSSYNICQPFRVWESPP